LASTVALLAVEPDTVDEPAGADGLRAHPPHALVQTAVGADEHDARRCGCGLLDQSVVAIVRGVDDTHAADVFLGGTGAGGAFEDDHGRNRDSPVFRRLTELFDELARRARPVPPPSGGLGPDDIGGVDQQHVPERSRTGPVTGHSRAPDDYFGQTLGRPALMAFSSFLVAWETARSATGPSAQMAAGDVAPAQGAVEMSLSDAGQGSASWEPAPRLVMIADDNEAMRETLADILAGEGYLVVEAEDGQVALDVLASSPVDVLVLDLAMPRMDGIEVLEKIRPAPPVVVVYSAFDYYTPDDARSRVGSKVFRTLRKPVAPAQLLSAVADAIEELDGHDR